MSKHWEETSQRWEHVSPPLKPVAEDLAAYRRAVDLCPRTSPRVLILGVTQEIYRMDWPDGTRLTAVDKSLAMIQNVWLGPSETAHCADWRAMPLADGSQDVVISDGGLTMLEFPDGIADLAREIARVLSKGGVCAFRLYVPPSVRQTPEEVLAELKAGKFPRLSRFKLPFWTAMQSSPQKGVVLADIWDAIDASIEDPDAFAERVGWPIEHFRALDTYRGSPDVYRFPTVLEIRAEFEAQGAFTFEDLCVPSYERGECCPMLILRRI